jgi:hypothetical protein
VLLAFAGDQINNLMSVRRTSRRVRRKDMITDAHVSDRLCTPVGHQHTGLDGEAVSTDLTGFFESSGSAGDCFSGTNCGCDGVGGVDRGERACFGAAYVAGDGGFAGDATVAVDEQRSPGYGQ